MATAIHRSYHWLFMTLAFKINNNANPSQTFPKMLNGPQKELRISLLILRHWPTKYNGKDNNRYESGSL